MVLRSYEKNNAILGAIVVALGVAASAPGLAKSSAASLALSVERQSNFLAEASGAVSSPTDGLHSRRCTDGYPMHHLKPCGTATGGPSGGLD